MQAFDSAKAQQPCAAGTRQISERRKAQTDCWNRKTLGQIRHANNAIRTATNRNPKHLGTIFDGIELREVIMRVTAKLSEVAKYISRGKSPLYSDVSDFKVINQACVFPENLKVENL